MVWQEVKKEGFSFFYYGVVLVSVILGSGFFAGNVALFPRITDPTLLQSVLLGVAVAATAIIPGVDPAVFLTTLGFYEMYVSALANLEFSILLPMLLGLAAGAIGISFGMSFLFKHFYTATYSVIFGVFLTMIPNMLTDNCRLSTNTVSVVSIFLLVSGFLLSVYLGDIENNNRRIKKLLKRDRMVDQ